MAELSNEPKGAELEDFVSAHFASRGCYVETCIKERKPEEILELDVVWTDYRKDPEERHPVEIKSGDWGLGDVFKFYGWTRYLAMGPGQFIHKEPCGRLDPAGLAHVQKRTGISFLHVAKPEDAEGQFKALGLDEPTWDKLPQLWRYSFWARRRLGKSLSVAIDSCVCVENAKAAKEYLRLVNDAVFFVPDMRDRIEKLLSTHLRHQQLGRSAAYERETGKVEFNNPPETRTFRRAYFWGEHFPVQACLYVEHRARLYIMKALVEYWLARERGEVEARKSGVIKVGNKLLFALPAQLTKAMEAGIQKLSTSKSFRLFPVFRQAFLWSWGGFLLKDRLDEEYAELEKESGVPQKEIPIALTAFDEMFPIKGGWFREPVDDARRVLILMPAPMRGIGAYRRLRLRGVENYKELSCGATTASRMAGDHNVVVRLLDCAEADLVK
ncbi:MAG: hypothetical protein JSS69_18910 [Acidobacteria bacterium]|nr:hypothetical protein [Acidobacteriota bacterium]